MTDSPTTSGAAPRPEDPSGTRAKASGAPPGDAPESTPGTTPERAPGHAPGSAPGTGSASSEPPGTEDLERVHRTARLARLALAPGEAERLAADFARLLDAFGELARVELEDAPAAPPPRAGHARPDVPAPADPARVERLLALAPERVEGFFAVPRTLGPGPKDAEPSSGDER